MRKKNQFKIFIFKSLILKYNMFFVSKCEAIKIHNVGNHCLSRIQKDSDDELLKKYSGQQGNSPYFAKVLIDFKYL